MVEARAPEEVLCPSCGGAAAGGKFDATFRDQDAGPKDKHYERDFFSLPGALCVACHQLFVDKGIIVALRLDTSRCTFAILSDAGARP